MDVPEPMISLGTSLLQVPNGGNMIYLLIIVVCLILLYQIITKAYERDAKEIEKTYKEWREDLENKPFNKIKVGGMTFELKDKYIIQNGKAVKIEKDQS